MPPVKVFWYDGLKEQPKIPGVPEGEWLGDLPQPRAAAGRGSGRGQRRRQRGSGGASADAASSGRVFN